MGNYRYMVTSSNDTASSGSTYTFTIDAGQCALGTTMDEI